MSKTKNRKKNSFEPLLKRAAFSNRSLVIFLIIFSLIGGYVVLRTFAAPTANCVRLSGESCFDGSSTFACNTQSKIGPVNGDTYSKTPTFAIDTAGKVSDFQYFIDGAPTQMQSTDSRPGGICVFPASDLSDGQHTFVARDATNSNITTLPNPYNFLVDSTPPDANISVPATIHNSALLQVKDTNGNSITDNLSGIWKVTYLRSVSGGFSVIGTVPSAPYAFSWSTSAVPNGTYTIMADAYNNAGGFKETTQQVTIINGNSTTPVVGITDPADSDLINGTKTVSASAGTIVQGASISKVEFYVDGTLKSTDISSPYSFNWNTTTSTNAQHSLTAKAYDNAAIPNVGTSSAVSVTVDNQAPSKPTILVAKPAPFSSIYVTWTQATDNNALQSYEIWVNNQLYSANEPAAYCPAADSTCSIEVDMSDASPSTVVSIFVKAIDQAGNSNSSTAVSTVVRDDINTAYLDDGTCVKDARKNGDPYTTYLANPSFYVIGDGNSASYSIQVDHWNGTGYETIFSGGLSTSQGNGKYCISLPANVQLPNDDFYLMTASEVSPTPDFSAAIVDFSVSTLSVPGDANGDGHVDALDLSKLLSNWGSANSSCDFNHDGHVDALDLSVLLSHWGL
ncbi:MAG TPA: Ig-like domain-containing protein [Candidatus Babeliales bacterium]|nr:Ig-like domain-containing protein [Candidatus Babeliales bacterium]